MGSENKRLVPCVIVGVEETPSLWRVSRHTRPGAYMERAAVAMPVADYDALLAGVERLREAMTQIERMYGDAAASDRPQFMLACQVASEAARAALAPTKETT